MAWFLYIAGAIIAFRVGCVLRTPFWLSVMLALIWPVAVMPLWDGIGWIREDA